MEDTVKTLVWAFILFFFFFLLLINWSHVSWVFNRRVITQFVSGIFREAKNCFLGEDLKKKEGAVSTEKKVTSTEKCDYSGKDNSIEIPKINTAAPLLLVSDESQVHAALDKGVVHFPNSALPGEKGTVVILGHSASLGWPHIKYDWVFSYLSNLERGDIILIYFNHCKYSYRVRKKFVLARGAETPKVHEGSQGILLLLTCWPPGRDYKRLAVEAVLVNK